MNKAPGTCQSMPLGCLLSVQLVCLRQRHLLQLPGQHLRLLAELLACLEDEHAMRSCMHGMALKAADHNMLQEERQRGQTEIPAAKLQA